MPTFTYLAGTKDGKTLKGQVEASDRNHAAEHLNKQNFFVLNLTKTSQFGPIDLDELKKTIKSNFGPEMGSVERMMFTEHLSSMLKTGVPMVEAIETFMDKKGNSRKQQMFEKIISDIEGGLPLSSAFAKFPKTFSPIYTHIVSSGESMGTLGETLSYLSGQLRKDHALISRVRSALIYPIVVLTIMVLVIGFITFSVVPKLLTFAQNVGKELPLSTKILIGITSFGTKYGIVVILGMILLSVLLSRFLKSPFGRDKFDRIMLMIPILGELTKRFNLARFSRLLGAFYHYGIPLPTAFSILHTALPNTLYQQIITNLEQSMSHGMSLSDGLDKENDKLFPKIMIRVIRSAEKSATVDNALWRLADYYEEELEESLKNLTTIIEPVLILILGIAVVGIALAVIVPIYQITTSIK